MNMEQDSEIKWGKRVGVHRTNKDVLCYESFTFQGIEYSLYDCVYLYQTGAIETYIGKIIGIYSTMKVIVVWLFRPAEISDFLGSYEPHWNEIFLASGNGKGVCNENPMEAIVGKCNVFCRLKDARNRPPSEEELRTANYFFRRTFDVLERKILKRFPDQICGIKVEEYFNRPKQQSCSRIPTYDTRLIDQAGPSNISSDSHLEKAVTHPVKNGKPSKSIPIVNESKNWPRPTLREQAGSSNVPSTSQLHKVVPCPVMNGERGSKPVPKLRDQAGPSNVPSNSELYKVVPCPVLNVKRKAAGHLPPLSTSDTHHHKKMKTADSRLSDIDKSGWFKTGLWEERMREAEGNGTLVLLDNLDPSTASSEVKYLVWTALKLKVDAKMIACTHFSNPRYGKAFVIFKSSDDAESAILQLNRRCLLADGRPLIGTICRGTLKEPDKTSRFFGHLTIDKHWLKSQREEMRKAVSTSHFAQPNTVEYDMAMDWCLLQAKSDLWWNALYQDHEEKEKEIKKLGGQKVKNFH